MKLACKYRAVTRQDDFKMSYTAYQPLGDEQLITDEVVEVECAALSRSKRVKYSNLLAQIVRRAPGLLADADAAAEDAQDGNLASANDSTDHNHSSSSSSSSCVPLNILLLSYDSLSRVSWFKRLPKTTRYMLDEMNFTVLYGQGILGDGTPACMIPLLTGKLEAELPSALKSDPNGTYVDQVFPFIWRDLHK